jgi:hypothetical protein
MTNSFAKKASTLGEALVWYHFIPASGPDGVAWYREYRDSGCEALAQNLDVSVALMRRRKMEEGKALLDRCGSTLQGPDVKSASRAAAGVAEEAYFGALAYYHYHHAEHVEARDALDSAESRIAEVVAEAPFLVTFTVKCYDFCLHRARIARSERRWPDMWQHIDQGREMLAGQRPLCSTRRGAVYIRDTEEFFRTATPTDDIERNALDLLRDRSAMIATFEKRSLGATMSPGIVIDY